MLYRKTLSQSLMSWIFKNPSRMIVFSFILVSFIGSLLLFLPVSTYSGYHLTYPQALFTSISATCITGLIVVDTASTFTIFGKAVILLLIQIGGMGLVTIASFLFSFTRKNSGLRSRLVQQETSGSFSFKDAPMLLRFIFGITFSIEIIGGILLSIVYVPKFGLWSGIGKAFFQSVAAFCNAGFDLMGNTEYGMYSSLTGFYDSTLVLVVTGFLILFGGLGFTVWTDLFGLIKKRRMKVHSKIVLSWTLALFLIGFLSVLIIESFNPDTLANLSVKDKILSSYFQSVTYRTAGFNSIDLASMTDASKIIAIILMFIGAGSGSTGGGIKITTFALLFYSVISEIRGEREVVAFRSKIHSSIIRKALSIFMIGLTVVTLLALLISLFESDALIDGRFSFVDILYESTSAFATVGVTTIGTASLTAGSKILLGLAMLLGRIGPISLAISLIYRVNDSSNKVYSEAQVHIG